MRSSGRIASRISLGDSRCSALGWKRSAFQLLQFLAARHRYGNIGRAVHMKLDELIRALQPARTHLVQMEEFSTDALRAVSRVIRFGTMASRTAAAPRRTGNGTWLPGMNLSSVRTCYIKSRERLDFQHDAR
jgi:hypothetical protein